MLTQEDVSSESLALAALSLVKKKFMTIKAKWYGHLHPPYTDHQTCHLKILQA